MSYNQIYADFGVVEAETQNSEVTFKPTEKIEREILVIGSLALENEEISEDATLLTHIL